MTSKNAQYRLSDSKRKRAGSVGFIVSSSRPSLDLGLLVRAAFWRADSRTDPQQTCFF